VQDAGELYQVFLSQPRVSSMGDDTKASSASSSQGTPKWSWDNPATDDEDAVPLWNPKTGFMQARADIEAAAAAAGDTGSRKASGASSSISSVAEGSSLEDMGLPAAVSVVGTASTSGEGDLPEISKQQVLGSCISTTGLLVFFGVLLRGYAQENAAAAMGTDPQLVQELLRLPGGIESWQNLGFMLGAAAGVTAARALLLSQWRDFALATHKSNKQVLTPLSFGDVVVVALLTGCSEEFLFRGSFIPATFPDWRGVLLAGVAFGLLHNNGGRNAAFAAWASLVGVLYGVIFVATGNVWVAAGAHTLGNIASAALWLSRNTQSKSQ
jgi:membrane protease YdiL (CAAX protease family)